MINQPLKPMLSFSKIVQLIATKKANRINEESCKDSKLLLQAYEEKNINKMIDLILSGAYMESTYDSPPLILKAALEGEKNIALMLKLLGADLNCAIIESTRYYKEDPRFTSAIQILFDCAALGCEWRDYKDSDKLSFANILKKIAKTGVDLNALNYLGFSCAARPLTKAILEQKGIKLAGGFFKFSDIKKMADRDRVEQLFDCIAYSLLKYGPLLVEGYYNFVSLKSAAEVGDTPAFLARIKSGWHLGDDQNKTFDQENLYKDFKEAIKGALKTDSSDIVKVMIEELMNADVICHGAENEAQLIAHKRYYLKEILFAAEHQACLENKKNILNFLREYFIQEKMDNVDKSNGAFHGRLHYALLRGDLELANTLIKSHPEIIHGCVDTWTIKGVPLSAAVSGPAYEAFFDLLLNTQFEKYKLSELYTVLEKALQAGNAEAVHKILAKKNQITDAQYKYDNNLLMELIISNIDVRDKIKMYEGLAHFIPSKPTKFDEAIVQVMKYDNQRSYHEGIYLKDKQLQFRLSQIPPLTQSIFKNNSTSDNEKKTIGKVLNKYIFSLKPKAGKDCELYKKVMSAVQKECLNPQSLLAAALSNRNLDGMEAALSLGADINAEDYLFRLVQNYAFYSLKFIKFFIEHGIDSNVRKQNGLTVYSLGQNILAQLEQEKRKEREEYGSHYYSELDSKIDLLEKTIQYLKCTTEDRQFNNDLKTLCALKENHQLEATQPVIKSLCNGHYSDHMLLRRFVRDLIKENNVNGLNAFIQNNFDFNRSVDSGSFYIPKDVRPPSRYWNCYDDRFDQKDNLSFFVKDISLLDLIKNLPNKKITTIAL